MKLWVYFVYIAHVCAANSPKVEVYNVLAKHALQLNAAVSLIKGAILPASQQFHILVLLAEAKGEEWSGSRVYARSFLAGNGRGCSIRAGATFSFKGI